VKDTLPGFLSHYLPSRFRKISYFIDSLVPPPLAGALSCEVAQAAFPKTSKNREKTLDIQ